METQRVTTFLRDSRCVGCIGVPDRNAEASQSVEEDTLCVVWMTAWMCGQWHPSHRLPDILAFVRKCLALLPTDFLRFLRSHPTYSPTHAGRAYQRLRYALTARAYLREWANI